MEGQGDSCRVEPLGERGSDSAVGFGKCQTLAITRPQSEIDEEEILTPAAQVHGVVS